MVCISVSFTLLDGKLRCGAIRNRGYDYPRTYSRSMVTFEEGTTSRIMRWLPST